MKIIIEFELKEVYEFPRYVDVPKLKKSIENFFTHLEAQDNNT